MTHIQVLARISELALEIGLQAELRGQGSLANEAFDLALRAMGTQEWILRKGGLLL